MLNPAVQPTALVCDKELAGEMEEGKQQQVKQKLNHQQP